MTLLTTKRLRGSAGILDHSIRKFCCGTSYAIWRVSIAVACFMSSMVIHSPGQRWCIEWSPPPRRMKLTRHRPIGEIVQVRISPASPKSVCHDWCRTDPASHGGPLENGIRSTRRLVACVQRQRGRRDSIGALPERTGGCHDRPSTYSRDGGWPTLIETDTWIRRAVSAFREDSATRSALRSLTRSSVGSVTMNCLTHRPSASLVFVVSTVRHSTPSMS